MHGLDLQHRVELLGHELDQPGDAAEGDAAVPGTQPEPGCDALAGAGLDGQVRHRAEESLRVGDG